MRHKSNGERLREWRKAHGWTQTEAGALIGAMQGTWGPWESGKKLPSVQRANQIERITEGAVPVKGWGEPEPIHPRRARAA